MSKHESSLLFFWEYADVLSRQSSVPSQQGGDYYKEHRDRPLVEKHKEKREEDVDTEGEGKGKCIPFYNEKCCY